MNKTPMFLVRSLLSGASYAKYEKAEEAYDTTSLPIEK